MAYTVCRSLILIQLLLTVYRYQGHSDNVKSVTDHKGKTRMATGKAEKPGETQLRQCVEKFLATYCQGEEHSSMSGLADALIEAEWDRETLIQSSWNDIKDQYDGSAWKPPMFVRLRTICDRWNK
ncbi:hypothetical protein F5880DRAFT_579036 [Lentinula raphanica]|nr:hypothetical protein F5880DRAFT_579036 [Lentinula raphanica]